MYGAMSESCSEGMDSFFSDDGVYDSGVYDGGVYDGGVCDGGVYDDDPFFDVEPHSLIAVSNSKSNITLGQYSWTAKSTVVVGVVGVVGVDGDGGVDGVDGSVGSVGDGSDGRDGSDGSDGDGDSMATRLLQLRASNSLILDIVLALALYLDLLLFVVVQCRGLGFSVGIVV